MSDPIADMITETIYYTIDNEGLHGVDHAAKQIRQQIGRELLTKTGNAVSVPESNKWADGWNDCRDVIREACQLENE